MKNLIGLFILLTVINMLFSCGQLYSQAHVYKISTKIVIGGENRWDYLSVDKTSNRLFVSNNTKVHVIDLKSNTVIGELSGLSGVHGIDFAPEFNKGLFPAEEIVQSGFLI
jgi:hypothetical protein